MMKYLSILFACMVMALSTMPCFLMDKCLFCETETACGCQDDGNGCGDCADCCSPFMHCSTCPGCTQLETVAFGTPVERVTVRETIVYADSPVSSYHPSIWQPPRA